MVHFSGLVEYKYNASLMVDFVLIFNLFLFVCYISTIELDTFDGLPFKHCADCFSTQNFKGHFGISSLNSNIRTLWWSNQVTLLTDIVTWWTNNVTY